jgi:hypothetical protein
VVDGCSYILPLNPEYVLDAAIAGISVVLLTLMLSLCLFVESIFELDK